MLGETRTKEGDYGPNPTADRLADLLRSFRLLDLAGADALLRLRKGRLNSLTRTSIWEGSGGENPVTPARQTL